MNSKNCMDSTDKEGESRVLRELRAWGANVDEALDRFLYDEELFGRSLHRFATEGILDRLGKELREGRVAQAFELAHSMKGTAAILSLTPLLGKITPVLEPLRDGLIPSGAAVQALERSYQEYCGIVEKETKA